jgi:hypothetical protein
MSWLTASIPAKITNQLAQGRLIDYMQHVAKFHMAGDSRRKVLPVGQAQGGNERVAMLPADLAVLVAVALVKAGLLHGAYFPWC